MNIVVAALYKFVALPDYEARRQPLLALCEDADLKGTILLAHEGINGTVSGSRAGIDRLLAWLRQDSHFHDLEHKESLHETQPFVRMKVKLKREIVTMGKPDVSPTQVVGTYVNPENWDSLLADPEVLVLDTRNDYECSIGSFRGAVDPSLSNFRQFPDWARENLDKNKHRKVAMFCTGGIRCEKASSYLLEQGFESVFHLKGGILKYLEEVPRERSSWEGECFVFDERVAVNHDLARGSYEQCFACRHPLSREELESASYVKGISCPRCVDSHSDEQRERFAERQHQIELAKARGEVHIGSQQASEA